MTLLGVFNVHRPWCFRALVRGYLIVICSVDRAIILFTIMGWCSGNKMIWTTRIIMAIVYNSSVVKVQVTRSRGVRFSRKSRLDDFVPDVMNLRGTISVIGALPAFVSRVLRHVGSTHEH